MLFKLSNDHAKLEAVGFKDFSDDEKLEKDLENLLAEIPALLGSGTISHALVALASQRLDLGQRGLLKRQRC